MSALIVIKNPVANLLSHPERWTKKCSARNQNGTSVLPDSEDACSWCLSGAIYKCYPVREVRLRIQTLVMIEIDSIWEWNDKDFRTHEQVLELCQRLGI